MKYEIHVALARTIYALNIGSVSRAMSNMGATQLHLIDPKCEMTYAAQQMAANGQEGLRTKKVYRDWIDFEDKNPDGVRIALTARDGRARTLYDLKEGLELIREIPHVKRAEKTKLYLIFGPEDAGLSGFEVDQAHYACSLPTFGANWSLNLAQAVLLTLYIVRDTWGGERTTLAGQNVPQSKHSLVSPRLPEKVIQRWIEVLGFDLSKRRINAYTVIRRLLLHHVPSQKELRILEAVLQQTVRKLEEHKHSRKPDGPSTTRTPSLVQKG